MTHRLPATGPPLGVSGYRLGRATARKKRGVVREAFWEGQKQQACALVAFEATQ